MAGKAAFGHIACRNGLLFPYFYFIKKLEKSQFPPAFSGSGITGKKFYKRAALPEKTNIRHSHGGCRILVLVYLRRYAPSVPSVSATVKSTAAARGLTLPEAVTARTVNW